LVFVYAAYFFADLIRVKPVPSSLWRLLHHVFLMEQMPVLLLS